MSIRPTIPRIYRMLGAVALFLSGWSSPSPALAVAPEPAAVQVTATPLAPSTRPCTDTFVARTLDHRTSTVDDVIRMFQANGAGAAAGDLNGDGDLDIVLGSLTGPDTILWNEGGLRFRKMIFGSGNTRAITIVDVDTDGRLDIVLTRATGVLNYWHNAGSGVFERWDLPGVAQRASVLNWADIDADGDLDLVTASYDAGLLTDLGNAFLLDGGGGVFFYENRAGRYVPTGLTAQAQAVAIVLADLDVDGRTDILVGNDFDLPDLVWLQQSHETSGPLWSSANLFATMSHSTMSLDTDDIDNDGASEIFATDMKPYAHDSQTVAAWAPVMAAMGMDMEAIENTDAHQADGHPQRMENVLQFRDETGVYTNRAAAWGVDGTGWSWSAKFGDLDSDGRLDLYVVNGMIEERLFGHLPNHELVEHNQAFRNDAAGRFEPMPAWRLDATQSGRGMVMADFDDDGDLDIVVNNLRGHAQLFENRLCGGDNLQIDLHWPDSANPNGIGAKLVLSGPDLTFYRTVKASSGYLSGDPPRVHFGLPATGVLDRLTIHWPDGAISEIANPRPNTRMTVTRP